MTTETPVDLVVLGLGPGGEHLATEAAKAGLTVVGVDERLVGGECPYYGLHPVEDGDPRRGHAGRGPPGRDPGRRRRGLPRLVRRRPADPRRGHRRLGRPRRRRAPREGGRPVRPRPRAARRPGDRRRRRPALRREPRRRPQHRAPHRPLPRSTAWPTPRSGPTATSWTPPTCPASMVVIGGGAIGAELAQAFARFGTQVSLVEVAPRILALEEPESSEVVAAAMAAEGVRVLAGATIRRVDHAEGRFTVSRHRRRGHRPRPLRRPAPRRGRAPTQPPRHRARDGRPRPGTARSVETDARMRAGRAALGDRRHRRQGRLHPPVDVPGEHRPPRRPRRRRPRGRVPRRPAGHLHRSGGRLGRDDRAAGPRRRARRRHRHRGPLGVDARVDPRSRRRGRHQARRRPAAGHLVGATAVGPSGGEVLSMLATAVHARVPVATLRRMVFAYPTFHRAVETALADLEE